MDAIRPLQAFLMVSMLLVNLHMNPDKKKKKKKKNSPFFSCSKKSVQFLHGIKNLVQK